MQRTRFDLDADLSAMPLFPLSQAALFPRAQLPLHVFEARYRKMLADCIEQHGIMAIVMVPDPADLIDPRGHPRLARVAGVGFVKEVARLPDGRSDIVLEGLARVSLAELPFEIPYRRARATLLETRASRVTQNDSAALVAAATAFVTEMRRRDADVAFELPEGLVAGQLADVCAHYLMIDGEARQSVLEELDDAARVSLVTRELAMQHASLTGGSRISN